MFYSLYSQAVMHGPGIAVALRRDKSIRTFIAGLLMKVLLTASWLVGMIAAQSVSAAVYVTKFEKSVNRKGIQADYPSSAFWTLMQNANGEINAYFKSLPLPTSEKVLKLSTIMVMIDNQKGRLRKNDESFDMDFSANLFCLTESKESLANQTPIEVRDQKLVFSQRGRRLEIPLNSEFPLLSSIRNGIGDDIAQVFFSAELRAAVATRVRQDNFLKEREMTTSVDLDAGKTTRDMRPQQIRADLLLSTDHGNFTVDLALMSPEEFRREFGLVHFQAKAFCSENLSGGRSSKDTLH